MLRELVYTEAVCERKYFFEKLFGSANGRTVSRGRHPQGSPLPPSTKSSAFPKSTLAGRSRTPRHLNAPTAHCRVHCRAFCPGRRTFLAAMNPAMNPRMYGRQNRRWRAVHFPSQCTRGPISAPRSAFPGSLRAILHRGDGKKPCNVHRTVRGNVGHTCLVVRPQVSGRRAR